MKSRKLGTNGFEVSEVGLGCWQLGGDWGDPIGYEKAFAIMQEAVDNGVTFFDTADVYGAGRSENAIGQFLKSCDTDIRIATKFGRGPGVYPDGYTMDALRSSVERSIDRLGVDALDLVQLHCIPSEVLEDGEIFDWLRELKSEGLIRHFGASIETIEQGLLCIQQEGLLSLQVIFNVLRQRPLDKLFPEAKEKGVGIIVRLPLASGVLSGKFTKDTSFDENDHRDFNKDGEVFNVGETFAGIPFLKAVELSDQLKNDFLPEGVSLAQFTQRWILDCEGVSTIIPGASSPEQARSNAQVSDLDPLSDEVFQQLRDFYKREVDQHVRGVY